MFHGSLVPCAERRIIKMKGKEPIKPHITHVMADGRVLDSIEGYVIPCSGHTAVVYRILADCVNRQLNSEKK